MSSIDPLIRRHHLTLTPDPRRVLLRPFIPSLVVKPDARPEPSPRILSLFARIMTLDDAEVRQKLDEVLAEFHERHDDIRRIFQNRFTQIEPLLPTDRPLNEDRRLLIGSYFTNEYSFESIALFNPSIVPAPEAKSIDSTCPFILSLRATGEGHVSSITFRTGTVHLDGTIHVDPASRIVHSPQLIPAAQYDLAIFRRKMRELGLDQEIVRAATEGLTDRFVMEDLERCVKHLRSRGADAAVIQAGERALVLAQANYTVRFAENTPISNRILFPYAPTEMNGIEDARFVRFTDEDGFRYYATYTAYDGSVVLPQMLETRDFLEFSICTLNGPAIKNKGLALFPRRIHGQFVMLGRQDSENIHIMFSDHLHFWHESEILLRPSQPWEFVQLGNCGSPLETSEGWLVLTHGVGSMRKYSIGAALLDLDNPRRVIKRLKDPLLRPAPEEREGYVPNVVYSCGGMIHGENLILPYAISDTASRFATVRVNDLLEAMTPI
ncbi:MAG: glycoside hydrolase family 130 protein [Candidatus Methylacidiphilales bacterium]